MVLQIEIPESSAATLAERARIAGITPEVFAARLLIEEAGNARQPIDLSMFGTMTVEDAKAIQDSVAEMDRWGLIDQIDDDANRAGH